MKRKTLEERESDLKDLREQIKKMQDKAREMSKQNKVQERKERTKRLIEIGAVVEKVYGKAIEKKLLPYLEEFLEKQNERGNYFTKALDEGKKILEQAEKEKSEAEEKVKETKSETENLGMDSGGNLNGKGAEQSQNLKSNEYQNTNFDEWEPNVK